MKSVPNYVKLVANELLILNDVSHNSITINNISNNIIMFFAVFFCCFGWRRSTLRLYLHFPCNP